MSKYGSLFLNILVYIFFVICKNCINYILFTEGLLED